MNGVRSTYMRKGYLLTALAAAVLLAASSGTAYAQFTIGFTASSGSIKENALLDADALNEPQRITVRVDGITAANAGDVLTAALGDVTVSADGVSMAVIVDGVLGGSVEDGEIDIPVSSFTATNSDVVLLVVQDNSEDNDSKDGNWVNEMIQVKLNATGTARLGTNIFDLMIEDQDMAPVVKFDTSSITLNEGNVRTVSLDVKAANSRAVIPADVAEIDGAVTVRVSNHDMVTLEACPSSGSTYGKYSISITESDAWDTGSLEDTGLIKTGTDHTIDLLSDLADDDDEATSAMMTITACGDKAGIRDRDVTLTILDRGLIDTTSKKTRGDISKGAPLMITVNSDEAAPTLSFSPTDVTIDEGGSTETVLLAEGMNATEVGMVKLMVEGDAMVSLMHDGEMLEEMGGYVMVDMGSSNSARLTAMSHSDRDLMDGDTAYKAWKLTEDSTDVNIGDGYWFRVDVRGSTAVPALPLVGQLLLALFLMAGGARLYRRRQG